MECVPPRLHEPRRPPPDEDGLDPEVGTAVGEAGSQGHLAQRRLPPDTGPSVQAGGSESMAAFVSPARPRAGTNMARWASYI